MEEIKIAMLQMSSLIGNVEANIEKAANIIKNNLPNNTDVLVLPEVWSCGWSCDKFIQTAQNLEGTIIKFLSEAAKDNNMNIIGGSFIEKKNGKYFNTCPVIDRNGKLVTTYSKNHLYSYYGCDEGKYITKGDNPIMVKLDGVNYGLTICYDIRFPEIYRAYRKAGVDILVNMAAWPLSRKIHWDSLTCARAVENQSYVIALTQTGVLPTGAKNLGHSMIYDYSGNIMDEIDTKEGIIKASLNLPDMYDFRDKCTVLKDVHDKYEVVLK